MRFIFLTYNHSVKQACAFADMSIVLLSNNQGFLQHHRHVRVCDSLFSPNLIALSMLLFLYVIDKVTVAVGL